MKTSLKRLAGLCLLLAFALSLAACSAKPAQALLTAAESDRSHYLISIEEEPDTVDFQCTSIYYTIAQNCFNRLVEMEGDGDGGMHVLPSLAESWEVSDDGLVYTFHLRPDVRFSNGEALTASDVRYTFTRMLTHPDACNRDIYDEILGADELERGEADTLRGFEILDELSFRVTLKRPFAAWLACLSMPAAAILDEQSTAAAGDRFGRDPAYTIGTGSFILESWTPSEGMVLRANPDCFAGAPKCEGLIFRFMTDPEAVHVLFENGELDIFDLDEAGSEAEYYIRGDVFRDRLYRVQRISITYIALNESVLPLQDVRVRKALQLGTNRAALLSAIHSGRGYIENGIFPHGLYGYNPELPEIPYDADEARALLEEAGYPDGFELRVSMRSSSPQWEMTQLRLVISMWAQIGVHATLEVLDEAEFMRQRKAGELECYSATWTADFNDPDNFIYTFFGSAENTRFRSLCYPREEIMQRVRDARTILEPEARLREYHELERIIVQEDAAWIPLYSRFFYYVASERLSGVKSSWNGSVKNMYREMVIQDPA